MVSTFERPNGWNDLAMYEKISIYAKHMTPQHAKHVDKLQAKQIVKEILGDSIEVARVVRVLDNWRDLKVTDLNPQHILKSSHASGWNINITNNTSLIWSLRLLKEWNCQYRPDDEYQYRYLTPTFFLEEKIKDSVTGGQCLTYMFRYIHGQLISIGVGYGHGTTHICNHYDIYWNHVVEPEIPFVVPKPMKLEEMIQMSKTLAQGFEFVRIDMFVDDMDKVYFSEFTFTPKDGKPVFPMPLEKEYGKLWI
jgi:hypothetical protein